MAKNTIEARVDDSRYVRCLVVEKCPYCGRQHRHAQGSRHEPITAIAKQQMLMSGCGQGEYTVRLAGLEGEGK